MSDLDSIFHELEAIDEQLDTLPADAFNERITLRQRKEELKAEVADLASHSEKLQPTDRLQAERSALRHKLDNIGSDYVDVEVLGGGGGESVPGTEGPDATGLDHQIDHAQGADEIRARISEIDAILRERGIEPEAEQI
jgi:hypothetical protein